jgi:hypothetical protein
MSNLPARLTDDAPLSRQVVRATRAQEKTELAVFEHHLTARYQAECDRIDSQAIADVTKSALENELDLLDWALERAGDSPAKRELVSRAVSLQQRIDNTRIARRYGG